MIISLFDKVEMNTVGKGENAGYHLFEVIIVW